MACPDQPQTGRRHTEDVKTIEVFADVSCPFTHVGLRRLVSRREQLGRDDVVLRVRSWPLELVNGAPLSGDFVGQEIVALRAAAAPDLFEGFDATHFPETFLPALALAASAYRRDDHAGERVSLALRTALFEQGRNVARRSELATIAESVGLDLPGPQAMDAIREDWHEGKQRGVIGSPYFFVDGDEYFCPNLDIRRVNGHFQITLDADGAEVFFDRCFS